MGSGLILLVIVGMWLAVLVPMALRNHDSATSLRSADRFSDAMRVLSRRGDSRDVLVPRRPYASLVVSETKTPRAVDEPPALTAAERRRRALLVLAGLSLASLGLALTGLVVAVVLHVACDLLLVAFVVHLRKQAVLRAAQRREQVRRVRRTQPAPVRRSPRIAGIPDRMPARPTPLSTPLPAPAARYEDTGPAAVAATGTDGTWSPVPVPPPTYVGKARAPRREPRVLDLTKPGEWTAALDDAGLDILGDESELDDILTRRRASGGW